MYPTFNLPLALLLVSAGPLCNGQLQEPNPGDLRLVSGSTIYNGGRLEIYVNGWWGTICDDGTFSSKEAALACNQLGYRYWQYYGPVGKLNYPQASAQTPIWVSKLECNTSRDPTIYNCDWSYRHSCTHNLDLALECSTYDRYLTRSSAKRLISKSNRTSQYLTAGRVEVFYCGRWGTICNNGFTDIDAQSLCSELTGSDTTLRYGIAGSSGLEFDQGEETSPVWIENLECSFSSNNDRYTCNHNGIGVTNCTHRQDVAISCLAEGAIRLVEDFGPLATVLLPVYDGLSGRLEIYHNGMWGTVCSKGFDLTAADIACQQLGYKNAAKYGTVDKFGYSKGIGEIWLSNIRCTVLNDVSLIECSHSGFFDSDLNGCEHSQDIAINCTQRVRGPDNTFYYVIAGIGGTIILCCCGCCCCICCKECCKECSASGHSGRTSEPPRQKLEPLLPADDGPSHHVSTVTLIKATVTVEAD